MTCKAEITFLKSVESVEAVEVCLGAWLKLCSQLSLAAGMWALGIALCFRLHLLAPPESARKESPHPPAFSLRQFLHEARSGVDLCVLCGAGRLAHSTAQGHRSSRQDVTRSHPS